MSEPKFKIGDQVRVVNYGHHIRGIKNGLIEKIDISPEVVGKVGTVSVVSSRNQYAIEGIPGKHSWYNEDQLEPVTIQPAQSPRNPKEEAVRLLDMHSEIKYGSDMAAIIRNVYPGAKEHARGTVIAVIKALEITTGHCTLSDQDLSEVRRDIDYWREVEREIYKL